MTWIAIAVALWSGAVAWNLAAAVSETAMFHRLVGDRRGRAVAVGVTVAIFVGGSMAAVMYLVVWMAL